MIYCIPQDFGSYYIQHQLSIGAKINMRGFSGFAKVTLFGGKQRIILIFGAVGVKTFFLPSVFVNDFAFRQMVKMLSSKRKTCLEIEIIFLAYYT